MPNPSTYPYRRFPTIQVGAADHAARGTDAVKQELHALCAGSSKTVVTVECYPGTDQAEILALFPHAELIIHADDLAIQPAELDAKIEHELTDDPVFGIMTTWQMKNFYPEEALCAARGKIDAVTDGLVLVYDNFRELLFACNIPHTGNGPRVHDFRHTFAVHTLEKQLSDGYDPMVIVPRLAAYLGHKSYRETCWYIHLTVASFPELSQKLDRAFVGIIPVGGETDEEN